MKGKSFLIAFIGIITVTLTGVTTYPLVENTASILNASTSHPDTQATLPPLLTNTPFPTIEPTITPTPTNIQIERLSNDKYYINSDGSTVHSPAYSDSIPSGASAICGDGTYSFSQSRRGTCSHHGGVSEWL